jgi:hypothetical protein
MPKEENHHKRTFVWKSLRISFWTMIGSWVLSTILGLVSPSFALGTVGILIGIISTISVFFTFVVSIIHLTKFKQKRLAIFALVISSILLLLILFTFLIGLLWGLSGQPLPLA